MPILGTDLDSYGLQDAARRRLDPDQVQGGQILGWEPGQGEGPASVAGQTGGQGQPGDLGGVPVGVGTPSLGAGVARWKTWAPAAPAQSVAEAVKARMGGRGLSKDPQLPSAPGGAYTDSQYQAENAGLEQQVNAAYADILQQTGFDVGGVHTPGSVEMQAARKERDYLTEMVNAANDVTGQMQQAGTIFSGYHAAERARREQPMITGLGDLNVDTPNTLARLTEQAGDLMRQFVAQRNALLAAAAWRQEQRLLAARAQAGAEGGGGGGGGGGVAEPGPMISGGTGINQPGEGRTATYPDQYPTGPGKQPAPWVPDWQRRKPKPVRSPYYYGGGG